MCEVPYRSGSFLVCEEQTIRCLSGLCSRGECVPRPIPTPVENLRPARETCETCHWPEKYGTDRLRVTKSYGDDGTEKKTVLLMRIAGGSISGAGIHGGILAAEP
jgi:hypothetical protein